MKRFIVEELDKDGRPLEGEDRCPDFATAYANRAWVLEMAADFRAQRPDRHFAATPVEMTLGEPGGE